MSLRTPDQTDSHFITFQFVYTIGQLTLNLKLKFKTILISLRSRRLEVVGERENGRARERHARKKVSRSLSRVFSCTHYFQAPASKRLLRRLDPNKKVQLSLKAL